MAREGDGQGRKILPLGQGDLDLQMLKAIVASGYRGPIGILGHTQDDAEQRLQDNLDGLKWLVAQLDGKAAGERPTPRTHVPPPPTPVTSHSGHHIHAAASETPVVVPADFDAKFAADLLAAATEHGDARRGISVLGSAKFACLSQLPNIFVERRSIEHELRGGRFGQDFVFQSASAAKLQ